MLGLIIRNRYYTDNHMSKALQGCYAGFDTLDLPQVVDGYKPRPLAGVWATPPFLHNGSVPNLYETVVAGCRAIQAILRRPPRIRSSKSWLRHRPAPGNHEGGSGSTPQFPEIEIPGHDVRAMPDDPNDPNRPSRSPASGPLTTPPSEWTSSNILKIKEDNPPSKDRTPLTVLQCRNEFVVAVTGRTGRRRLMAKNIVICIDGTGNEFGASNSNVVKLYSVLKRDDASQIAFYHPGLGTMGSPDAVSAFQQWWTRTCGLAFGYGLSDALEDSYTYLMENFEENDTIFIFGFSRGAYIARALAAMVHMYGLMQKGNEPLIRYVLKMFTKKKRTDDDFQLAAAIQGHLLAAMQDAFRRRMGYGELNRLAVRSAVAAFHENQPRHRSWPPGDFDR